jgi:hypothetical protein
MSLKEDLEKLVERSSERIPQETLSVMTADTERLKKSGIVDRSLKAGDKAPIFVLPNAKGEQISLADLLAQGPVVLSFYRGGW